MPSTLGALDRLPVVNEGDSSKRMRAAKLHVSGNYIWTRVWKNVLGHSWGNASAASDLFASCGGTHTAGDGLALPRMEAAGAKLTGWLQVLLEFQRDWTRHETCAALVRESRKMVADMEWGSLMRAT